MTAQIEHWVVVPVDAHATAKMPNLIEDHLSSLLAEWMTSHRPAEIPESVPFHVARRDDIRTRPCVVLNPTESKPIPGMPHTARVKLDVHLFSQVDDTSAEDHALWAGKLIARNLLFHLRRRIHWRAGLGRGKGGSP
jgi:hypothetical protein